MCHFVAQHDGTAHHAETLARRCVPSAAETDGVGIRDLLEQGQQFFYAVYDMVGAGFLQVTA